jgi:hypothetical protein
MGGHNAKWLGSDPHPGRRLIARSRTLQDDEDHRCGLDERSVPFVERVMCLEFFEAIGEARCVHTRLNEAHPLMKKAGGRLRTNADHSSITRATLWAGVTGTDETVNFGTIKSFTTSDSTSTPDT